MRVRPAEANVPWRLFQFCRSQIMPSAASHLARPPFGVRCLGTAFESGAEAPHSKNGPPVLETVSVPWHSIPGDPAF